MRLKVAARFAVGSNPIGRATSGLGGAGSTALGGELDAKPESQETCCRPPVLTPLAVCPQRRPGLVGEWREPPASGKA